MERRPAFSIVRIIIKSRAMKNVHKIKFHKKKRASSLALWLSYLIKTAFTLEKRDVCFNFWGWRLYKFVYIHSLGPAKSSAFHSLPRMQGLNVLARGTDYAGARAVRTVTSYVRVNVCTLGRLPTKAYPVVGVRRFEWTRKAQSKAVPVFVGPFRRGHFPVTFVSVFMIISNPREMAWLVPGTLTLSGRTCRLDQQIHDSWL